MNVRAARKGGSLILCTEWILLRGAPVGSKSEAGSDLGGDRHH